MKLIMLENSANTYSHQKKNLMSLYGESQFDSQLSQPQFLDNAWRVELWDDCEHS